MSRISIRPCIFLLALLAVPRPAAHGQSLSWFSISGVPGCITVKEGAGGKLFSASDGSVGYNGVLYSSVDDGQSWYPTAITYGWIFEVVTNQEHVILSRYLSGGRFPYQVFQSDDNGVTWKGIMSSDIFFNPYSGFMYSDSGTIFAVDGGNSSQLVRLDGQRWDPIGALIPAVSFTPFGISAPTPTAIDHDGRIYVGTVSNGLYLTSNQGTTWTQALAGLNVTAVAVNSPREIVVGTSPNTVRNGGLFISADTGRSWTYIGLAEEHISSIAIDDSGGICTTTSTGVFRYGGVPNSWKNISPSTEPYGGVEVAHSGSIFAAAIQKGVFRSSDNGKSWFRSGIPKEDIGSLIVTGGGAVVAGSLGNRVFTTTNNGGTWGQSFPGEICDNVFSLLEAQPGIFAGTDCGIYESTDGGRVWANVSAAQFTGGAFALAKDGQGTIFAGTNFGVYASTDNGTTWTSSGLGAYKIIGVAVNSAGNLFALSGSDGVFASIDGGRSWTSAGLVRTDLQTIAANGGNLYVGAGGGIFVSTDNGTSWALNPVTNAFVYALAFTNASTIVAGTGNGIFVSIDGGTSWVQRNAGLSQAVILAIGVDAQGYLYAGALHGGVCKSTQVLSGVEETRGEPVAFGLMQNYPNPFNPVTTIDYRISRPGRVTLKIYDLLGTAVATIVDEMKAPGEYTARWDAANAASGMYFYTLRAGTFSDVKKMILLK